MRLQLASEGSGRAPLRNLIHIFNKNFDPKTSHEIVDRSQTEALSVRQNADFGFWSHRKFSRTFDRNYLPAS